MLIPYNDTACIVCVIAGRGTVTPYTLILRTLSRCTQSGVARTPDPRIYDPRLYLRAVANSV